MALAPAGGARPPPPRARRRACRRAAAIARDRAARGDGDRAPAAQHLPRARARAPALGGRPRRGRRRRDRRPRPQPGLRRPRLAREHARRPGRPVPRASAHPRAGRLMRSLTALEISSGLVLPPARRAPALPRLEPGTTPRMAFEAAVRPLLDRSPCLVSFSGGRDSSAVLAAATAIARREGLRLPVPVTHRFPSAALTQETEWQEQVIGHLGLSDWVRIDAADDLDCVGPVATEVLRRHGLLWPCNAYFHAPIFEAAAGGAVLTGVGGDEAFSPSSWTHAFNVLKLKA